MKKHISVSLIVLFTLELNTKITTNSSVEASGSVGSVTYSEIQSVNL